MHDIEVRCLPAGRHTPHSAWWRSLRRPLVASTRLGLPCAEDRDAGCDDGRCCFSRQPGHSRTHSQSDDLWRSASQDFQLRLKARGVSVCPFSEATPKSKSKAGSPGKAWTTHAHAEAFRAAKAAWRQARRLGLDGGEFQGILAKRCLICGSDKRLVLDHDHKTGQVRGRLCGTCNSGLGMFRDSPELLVSAIEYLEDSAMHRDQPILPPTADEVALAVMAKTGRPHLSKLNRPARKAS